MDLRCAHRAAARAQHLAGGGRLAPVFPAHELGSSALEPVSRVLDKVLAGHEPYPAWVIRQPLTIVRANTGAELLFPGLTQLTPDQLIDLWYGPGPFHDQVVNWPDVVQAGFRRCVTPRPAPATLR